MMATMTDREFDSIKRTKNALANARRARLEGDVETERKCMDEIHAMLVNILLLNESPLAAAKEIAVEIVEYEYEAAADALTRDLGTLIRHSLGLKSKNNSPYRRHYCSPETPVLREGVERGFITGPVDHQGAVAPMWYITEAGARWVGSSLPEE